MWLSYTKIIHKHEGKKQLPDRESLASVKHNHVDRKTKTKISCNVVISTTQCDDIHIFLYLAAVCGLWVNGDPCVVLKSIT